MATIYWRPAGNILTFQNGKTVMPIQHGVMTTTFCNFNELNYKGYWIIYNSGGLWEVAGYKVMFDSQEKAKKWVDEHRHRTWLL